jgi:hypothetical protein
MKERLILFYDELHGMKRYITAQRGKPPEVEKVAKTPPERENGSIINTNFKTEMKTMIDSIVDEYKKVYN